MVMIWRGWAGGLSLLCLILGFGFGAAIGGPMSRGGDNSPFLLFGGLGLIVGAVGAYFLGRYANKIAPARKVEALSQQRHRELHDAAERGQFSLGPGHTPPRSLQEAHEQADQLLAAERTQMASALDNRHHVWFIPAQYWGFIGAAVGVVLVVASFVV